jgi:DNA-directed RNA polymerase specialized sigma24 family protein
VARKGSGDDQDTDRGDDALVNIMRRLAGGDQAAVVTLYERYGGPIAAAVRRTARSRPGRLDRDDVDGLVFEVCFELAAVAAAWSPAGGALPWVWARHRVANAVDRVLGIVVEPLDDERLPGPDSVAADAGADDLVAGAGARARTGSLLDTLGHMAPDMASASLLAEAIDRGRVSRRDGALLLEYAYEKHSGNVSPAATVAPVFGMKEVSVRQAARRARQRLLRLAATEERFAPLADLPLLA